jgi:alcohol dehydrogenase class IV
VKDQKVFIGGDSVQIFKNAVAELASRKILLVRGKSSFHACGAEKFVLSALKDACYLPFFDFNVNPKIDDVVRGVEQLKLNHCNLIVAIGGGSVLDMAKSIAFFDDDTSTIEQLLKNNQIKARETVPIIALPTTAGTGAEATHFATLYVNKEKFSIVHPCILPTIAIINPTFTYGTPRYLSACAAMDALAQSIESYWSASATTESEQYSERAIKMLWPSIPQAVNDDDPLARQNVAEGAYWAGKAINIARTTGAHALSYPFTIYYGFAHGHAVALSLPFFLNENFARQQHQLARGVGLQDNHQKMHKLFDFLQTDRQSASEIMVNYIQNIGLTFDLPRDFDVKVTLANVNEERAANNPVRLNGDSFRRALESIINKHKTESV